jgi:dsDNA-binding SOS-regulon protein
MLDRTADNATDTCADSGRQHNEAQRPVLRLWLVQIRDQTKRNATTSCRKAALEWSV